MRKIMEVEMDTPSSKSHTLFIVFTERKEKDGRLVLIKKGYLLYFGRFCPGMDQVMHV